MVMIGTRGHAQLDSIELDFSEQKKQLFYQDLKGKSSSCRFLLYMRFVFRSISFFFSLR